MAVSQQDPAIPGNTGDFPTLIDDSDEGSGSSSDNGGGLFDIDEDGKSKNDTIRPASESCQAAPRLENRYSGQGTVEASISGCSDAVNATDSEDLHPNNAPYAAEQLRSIILPEPMFSQSFKSPEELQKLVGLHKRNEKTADTNHGHRRREKHRQQIYHICRQAELTWNRLKYVKYVQRRRWHIDCQPPEKYAEVAHPRTCIDASMHASIHSFAIAEAGLKLPRRIGSSVSS
ncbi:hypothetical protein B0T11DRAFT_298841 [Plectosphaerella cucumerina]|uniref:Uncharacterized protein n=1 Tax=Plectosphaerella cucumerina TaxID=40658 RepID=A0A8K0TH91_9PEZI|nr:hypothetical protein B0T11DRAFT_298841 [Plectosphaerella cucumerina]